MFTWKKPLLATAAVLAIGVTALPAHADGLDDFLRSVNVQAQTNIGGFPATISAQFGVPVTQVGILAQKVRLPSDVFMIYQLAQWSGRPPLEVYDHYRREPGWGRLAQNLGIKPGSAQFHALKRGELRYSGMSHGGPKSKAKGRGDDHGDRGDHRGNGNGNGKGNGHGKDWKNDDGPGRGNGNGNGNGNGRGGH